MGEAVSALFGAEYDGFVKVSDTGLRGMITVRGDLKSAKMKAAVKKVTGCEVPDAKGMLIKGDKTVAWMSPDELLVMIPYDGAGKALADLDKVLKDQHYLAVNVSDARAVIRLSGAAGREVVAKLSPSDVSPDAFGVGQMRRTRFAQVAAACWMLDDDTIEIMCFRSTADYVFKLLKNAAAPGSEVSFF